MLTMIARETRTGRLSDSEPKGQRGGLRLLLALTGLASLAGCTVVPVNQQRLVAKPGMLFADEATLYARSALRGQLESGAAVSGGAQAAGCTSCR